MLDDIHGRDDVETSLDPRQRLDAIAQPRDPTGLSHGSGRARWFDAVELVGAAELAQQATVVAAHVEHRAGAELVPDRVEHERLILSQGVAHPEIAARGRVLFRIRVRCVQRAAKDQAAVRAAVQTAARPRGCQGTPGKRSAARNDAEVSQLQGTALAATDR